MTYLHLKAMLSGAHRKQNEALKSAFHPTSAAADALGLPKVHTLCLNLNFQGTNWGNSTRVGDGGTCLLSTSQPHHSPTAARWTYVHGQGGYTGLGSHQPSFPSPGQWWGRPGEKMAAWQAGRAAMVVGAQAAADGGRFPW